MQVSAEIRWFWKDAAPAGLPEWFSGTVGFAGPAGGGRKPRTDLYLVDPSQQELGVKYRNSALSVEVKGRVGTAGTIDLGGASPTVELWSKWKSEALAIPQCLAAETVKLRWLRKFAVSAAGIEEVMLDGSEAPLPGGRLPPEGCNVELTRVTLGQATWWTFGLESFGPLEAVAGHLRAVAGKLQPPALTTGNALSYPAWLSAHAG